MKSHFLGIWTLLPKASKYEKGDPPKEATYIFRIEENNRLNVEIEWTNHENRQSKMQNSMIPDGQIRNYENSQVADKIMCEFITEKQLNSSTYKKGKLMAFASRIIEDKNTMKVV
ncbi:MAG: hypothetical protein AAGH46_10470, partial [Bacteroidota bacterium]